jgi:hypothetical protein
VEAIGASDARPATPEKVVIGAPTRVEVEATRAYVIVPATYTFTARAASRCAPSRR